jgi:hypothetical protein
MYAQQVLYGAGVYRCLGLSARFSAAAIPIDQAQSAGTPARKPLMEMRVKSLIARPALREIVKLSARYRVFGAAWAGGADVETLN